MERHIAEKQLPIGKSGEFEKKTLPAIEIKNNVIWINGHFPAMPFRLEKNQPTRLGMFLSPDKNFVETRIIEDKPARRGFIKSPHSRVNKKLPVYNLEIRSGHGRSGMIGRVLFADEKGNAYRDVDLKGIGFIECGRGLQPEKLKVKNVWSHDVASQTALDGDHIMGLRKLEASLYDAEMTEKLFALGVRTNRILAVLAIEEIVIDENPEGYMPDKDYGKRIPHKISIEDAKARKIIPQNMNPSVEIRAYGTKARIHEKTGPDYLGKRKNIFDEIEDGRYLVAQELGKSAEKFNLFEYLKWMVKTSARNIAILHKNGLSHGYANGQNITLDGRLVDFDSVSSNMNYAVGDIENVKSAMQYLLNQIISALRDRSDYNTLELFYSKKENRIMSEVDVDTIFNSAYEEALNKYKSAT